MTEDENSSAFKVKDRRRFDSDGNERSPDKEEAKATVASPSQASQKIAPSRPSEPNNSNANLKTNIPESVAEEFGEQEITFSSFVMSLATQALMQLGEIKPPPGVQIEVDKAGARQTIDILTMLENKTKGNLDSEEAHLIEGILHNLRLSFVRASK